MSDDIRLLDARFLTGVTVGQADLFVLDQNGHRWQTLLRPDGTFEITITV